MKYYHINHKIRAPKIRLIDEKDNHIGIIETERALEMTREKGLDLVEISPKADPPVAKILDFGKFKYELQKKEKLQKKQKKVGEIKGIRLTPRIGKHDLSVRAKKAKTFLSQGQKIKIEMILRGREKAHFNLAKNLIKDFITSLGDNIQIEQPPKRRGHRIIAIIAIGKDNADT
ncbi:translation initiation factor IF-3 [Patescibacteria group bacterium AH-259-L07]|nr:translation initiation factor IF-3 [Patescibacteria group bacterium AH-259-L07]